MSGRPLILFATGGTGGHIYPALAAAREVQARGYEVAVIGQQGGMEAHVVPREGVPFYGVAAGKWDRQRPDPRQALQAGRGLWEAVGTVRNLKPKLVVGFGGFASFPGLAAARILHVPYVLHEANALPGKVTRLFAGGARAVAVAHSAAEAHLGNARRLVVTGFPVREARVPKSVARSRLGLPERALVTLVMGGSQGSRVLNEQVPRAYAALGGDTWVLHSTGERWLEEVRSTVHEPRYLTSAFVDAALAWSAADLAITRAGFGTLSEAAFHGVPTIMVPLPSAAEHHQLHNAQAVARAGAGWVVEERDLAKLGLAWRRALEPEARQRASAAARRLSPAGAAAAIANLLDDVLAQGVSALSRQESL